MLAGFYWAGPGRVLGQTRRDYRQTTSVSSLLDQLGWPSLSDRRLNNRLKIFGKTVAGRVAIDTGDLAQPLRQTHYSSRSLLYCSGYWY